MTLPIAIISMLTAILVAAAFFDLATYTIPNMLPAAMLLLFAVFLLAMALTGHPLSWHQISPHLIAGGLGLLVGMAFFAFGWVGGGDSKLFAMTCLWLGWGDAIYQYALIASLLGGLLTVGLLMFRRILYLPRILAEQPWLMRLADRQSGVPYGVALACAAIGILPDTEIFHLALAS
jgi:prepilin peptidase CpaA